MSQSTYAIETVVSEEIVIIDGVEYPIIHRTFEGDSEEMRGYYEVTYPYILLNKRYRRLIGRKGEWVLKGK